MAKTHEQFVYEIAQINPDIEIIGTYTRAVDRIEAKCKLCGQIWYPKAYYLSEGKSCPHCSAKRGAKNNSGKTGLKTQEQFVFEMSQKYPTIKIEGQYINGHTNISCTCEVCKHTWSAKPYSLLQGHGCPRCAKSGTSFMEQFIKNSFENVLGTDAVISRDKQTIGMELDIYIPALKIAFEPGNWNLHKRSLKRDAQKREKCFELGIRLITIYDKFPKDATKPFDKECYTFEEDLNKANRKIIQQLVSDLFEECGLCCCYTETDWENIEKQAYENSKAKTHEDFVEEMKEIHPNIEIVGRYENANKKIAVRCITCGFEWQGVPANMLAGDGCRKCGTKKAHQQFVKTQEEFEREVFQVNPDIQIVGKYTGRHNPVRARCRVCGYEWEPNASSLLRGSNHKGWKGIHKKMESIDSMK